MTGYLLYFSSFNLRFFQLKVQVRLKAGQAAALCPRSVLA